MAEKELISDTRLNFLARFLYTRRKNRLRNFFSEMTTGPRGLYQAKKGDEPQRAPLLGQRLSSGKKGRGMTNF